MLTASIDPSVPCVSPGSGRALFRPIQEVVVKLDMFQSPDGSTVVQVTPAAAAIFFHGWEPLPRDTPRRRRGERDDCHGFLRDHAAGGGADLEHSDVQGEEQ